MAVIHYIPLHSAPEGLKCSCFKGEDVFTTKESERLLRLPLYYSLKENDVYRIINMVKNFFNVMK